MLFVSRKEQESIALKIEKDFAALIGRVNRKSLTCEEARVLCGTLVGEIAMLNRQCSFEDDLQDYLFALTGSIKEYQENNLSSFIPACLYKAVGNDNSQPPLLLAV